MKNLKKKLVTFCLFALLAAPVIGGVLPNNCDYGKGDEGISTCTAGSKTEGAVLDETHDDDIHD